MASDTLRLTLPKSLVKLIDAAVSDGEYVDRSDVVRAALRSFLGA